MQRQHARSSLQRGIETLSTQRPCFFFLDLTCDATVKILQTCGFSNQISSTFDTASQYSQWAVGRGTFASVIQYVGVNLLLIEIIVPYLVLMKKKNTYTRSVAFQLFKKHSSFLVAALKSRCNLIYALTFFKDNDVT